MLKYKVKREFKDKDTGEVYSIGDVVEFTKKRAGEAEKNLKTAVDDDTAVFFVPAEIERK